MFALSKGVLGCFQIDASEFEKHHPVEMFCHSTLLFSEQMAGVSSQNRLALLLVEQAQTNWHRGNLCATHKWPPLDNWPDSTVLWR